ncbi:hypothetical protein ACFVJM_28880 [Streptomyces virginiae]|uniref:hypothetical protein n=1 Tax=Streptomyces virginiae TaxID=1961 RepID=UPI0036430122
MNTTSWWTGGRLLAAAVLLAGAGIWMLSTGLTPTTIEPTANSPGLAAPTDRPEPAAPARPASSNASAPTMTPEVVTPSESPRPATAAATATSPSPAGSPGGAAPASELPPPGSGPAADPLIQQALDQASRPDLPPADEQHLVTAGRAAWLAETVRYTQVRIQAATARRAPDRDGAVVRLVWAGADPAGTYLDGRTAALHYIRNGEGSWTRT